MPKHQNSSKTPQSSPIGWSLIVTAICLILFSLFLPVNSTNKSQPYSQFIELVESDRVEKVTIGSSHIEYILKSESVGNESEQKFTTVIVAQDTELPKLLRQHQVEFSAIPTTSSDGFWGFIRLLFFLFLIINSN